MTSNNRLFYWYGSADDVKPSQLPNGAIYKELDTGKRYKYVDGMWIEDKNLDDVKVYIERLRWLGIPAQIIIELEDWVREQGGYA